MSRPVMDPDHPEYSNDDPTVARAQELAQMEAETQMINERMGEDINGFVERPKLHLGAPRQLDYDALLQTAENGKAVRIAVAGRSKRNLTAAISMFLRTRGYRFHSRDTKDSYLTGWCERIDAASEASRPTGARP